MPGLELGMAISVRVLHSRSMVLSMQLLVLTQRTSMAFLEMENSKAIAAGRLAEVCPDVNEAVDERQVVEKVVFVV